MGKVAKLTTLITALLVWIYAISSAAAPYLRQFFFNEEDALKHWKQRIVEGKVEYFIDLEGENGFVHACSDGTSSALYRRVGFKPKKYPFLSWKWRVLKFPKKEKEEQPPKDDYAIRVYVIYLGLSFSSSRFIEYIWAEHLPEGTIQQSPSAKNIMQIVVRSGRKDSDEWFQEERNVYQDYEKAFGQKSNRSAGAIAILCNSNLTKSQAEALVDDITIGMEPKMEVE